MIVVNNKKELKELIIQRIREQGLNCDLNDIDVSKVTDMSELFMSSKFEHSTFNGDISGWNVSNVEYMNRMFENSKFNGDLSRWDASKVRNMYCMFYKSPIDSNEPGWYKE